MVYMTDIIVQTRTRAASRLPNKILKTLCGKTVFWHVIDRLSRCQKANRLIVATTTSQEDDVIEEFCKANKILFYRGASENALERFYETAKKHRIDSMVRVTGGDPLIDPTIIDLCISEFQKGNYDYLSNVYPPPGTFPKGLEAEVFSFAALEKAYLEASEDYEKNNATPYLWENKKREFKLGPTVRALENYRSGVRLTLDYQEDFDLLEKVYQQFYKPGEIVNVPEVLKWLAVHPEIASLNAHCVQREPKGEAIAILGGGLKKDGHKWRTTNFNEGDEFGCLGDRLRVVAGSYLYGDREKVNPNLLMIASGGRGQLENVSGAPTLAEVISAELADFGVPVEKILKENQSANTYQQLRGLDNLVLARGLTKFFIISNEYHLPRIQAMVELAPGLHNLRNLRLNNSLFLESAEKIVLSRDRFQWEDAIKQAYETEVMKERVRLEESGVAKIRAGTYQLK